ncbi:MAG: C25 family cysteine peptidase [Planctomycetota bacterium]
MDSDVYWSHLDGTFNDDLDSEWGEVWDTGIDLYSEIYIGRITCDEPQDVSNWLNKLFFYMDSEDPDYLDNAAFYGGNTGWPCEGDDYIDYSAIKGADHWMGPNPDLEPYPEWLGFQYGFETWNEQNPGALFDLSVKWTEEPPNPGWNGPDGVEGLREAINNNECTLLSGMAHADANRSLDVEAKDWEIYYHNTKPFLLHDYGCHCGDMDAEDDGVLHSMLFHSPRALAFGCVYHTGYGWGSWDNTCAASPIQQKCFWDYLFDTVNNSGSAEEWQLGKAQAFTKDFMAPMIDWDPDLGHFRGVFQCCLLFGDPALRIRPPAEPALYISFPLGRPGGLEGLVLPGPAQSISVCIRDGQEQLVANTGMLHYRFDPGDAFTAAPLAHVSHDRFEALVPETCPGDQPEYYISAEGDGGTLCSAPWDAPAEVYAFELGFSWTVLEDDFETESGWTVESFDLETGEWERTDPEPTEAQPGDDHSVDGVHCFVTDGRGGGIADWDVDGGPTHLISPWFDLEGKDAYVRAYLWFYHGMTGQYNPLQIAVTEDDQTWQEVKKVYPKSGWHEVVFRVSDALAPPAKVRVRYSATDNPKSSIVEAALDDLTLERILTDASSLWADAYSISASTGAAIQFSIDAGPAHAGRAYLLLGSLSGACPGFILPGGAVLPLNWDAFTDLLLVLANSPACQNFMANLDQVGTASAKLDTLGPLDPAAIGLRAHFAFVLGNPYDFVSNPLPVLFVP